MYTLCLWVSLDIWKHWVNCLPLPPHEPKSPQLRRRRRLAAPRRFVHSALLQPNGAILLTLWHLLINHCTVAILILTPKKIHEKLVLPYRCVPSTSPSHFDAHAGLFRLSMKGKFDGYLLWTFGKKLISKLSTCFDTHDSTVIQSDSKLFFKKWFPKSKFFKKKTRWFLTYKINFESQILLIFDHVWETISKFFFKKLNT